MDGTHWREGVGSDDGNGSWMTEDDEDGMEKMAAGSHSRLVPLACPPTMKELRSVPMRARGRIRRFHYGKGRQRIFVPIMPSARWHAVLCPMTSTVAVCLAHRCDCCGVDAAHWVFFVLCWWVAAPKTAKPYSTVARSSQAKRQLPLRHSEALKHARRRFKEMQAGTMRCEEQPLEPWKPSFYCTSLRAMATRVCVPTPRQWNVTHDCNCVNVLCNTRRAPVLVLLYRLVALTVALFFCTSASPWHRRRSVCTPF